MAAARESNGRWKKGQSGNPNGRPKRTTEERYLRIVQRTVTPEDFEKILITGISRAKAGDLGWARFLAEYLIGKPVQRTDITTKGESLNEGRLSDGQRASLVAALLERASNKSDRPGADE